MTRLNNDIRQAIGTALIDHKFLKQRQDLIAAESELALVVYREIYSVKELQLMESLPDGWLQAREYLDIISGFGSQRLLFNGEFHMSWPTHGLYGHATYRSANMSSQKEKETFLIPHKHVGQYMKVPNDIRKTFDTHIEKKQKLVSAVNGAITAIRTALTHSSSVEKLIDAWPEVEPFAKPYIEAPAKAAKVNLPAIAVSSLNAMLDLPTE